MYCALVDCLILLHNYINGCKLCINYNESMENRKDFLMNGWSSHVQKGAMHGGLQLYIYIMFKPEQYYVGNIIHLYMHSAMREGASHTITQVD